MVLFASSTLWFAGSAPLFAESGRWAGTWRKPDGVMRKSGVYLARWVPSGGTWRLKSELFVTLKCTGSPVLMPSSSAR